MGNDLSLSEKPFLALYLSTKCSTKINAIFILDIETGY